jgi:hypothetical protein
MNLEGVAKLRLINHQIAYSATQEPGEVVASLGAMQAQYAENSFTVFELCFKPFF